MVNNNKVIPDQRDNTDTQESELEQLRIEKAKDEEKDDKKKKKSSKSSSAVSVDLFLKKELNSLKSRRSEKPYNFEEEFAKTRKNRSFYIPMVLILCALGLAGLVYGTFVFMAHYEMKVDLSDGLLEQVNVEDLADEITRTTVMYENSLKNIASLKANLEEKLSEAKKQYDFNLYVIDSMNIEDKREVKTRKAACKSEYKKALEEIHSEMDEKIFAVQTESDGFKARLESYEQQAVLNTNQDEGTDEKTVLARLEREKIIRDYEMRLADLKNEFEAFRTSSQKEKEEAINTLSKKYQDEIAGLDPELNDKDARTIIASSSSIRAGNFNISKFTDKAEKIRDTHLRSELKKAQEKFENYEYLYNAVKDLPQKHSVPDYLKTGNKLVISASNEIVEAAVDCVNNLADKYEAEHSEKEVMENAVGSLLISQGKKAVVIDCFDDRLRLFVTQDVLRRLQKEVLRSFIMIGDKKVEGQVLLKNGIIYFIPDAVDLSEKIDNFTTVSIGTEVEIL